VYSRPNAERSPSREARTSTSSRASTVIAIREDVVLSLVTFLFLTAARQRVVHHPGLDGPPADQFTFSNASAVTTRHLALDLTVDFDARQLHGTATLSIENLTGASTLVLDTNRLTVTRVTLDSGTPTLWSTGLGNSFGQPLTIGIKPETRTVTIEYATDPGAEGLFWNTAEQSFGRQEPYLYSLNEPTGARSWIPIQDTPSTRMTYEATLHVPPQLLALMSAENNPVARNASGVYTFRMTKTLPAYLIALAVGRLEFRALDGRSGVYAEPELIGDAQSELQYVPSMIDAAEDIAGPYPFTRYDVLLMPPTFVAGGMEHPTLNFINPFSVVSQNHRPNVEPKNLIAHELAHAWAGDAVTLATWNDVWLNEGITSYLSWRIIEEVVSEQRAELGLFLDWRSYTQYAIQPGNQTASILHRQVTQPNEGFGATGYQKGELFLRTLEGHLGRPTLDAFLQRWFTRFAWRWVDERAFVATLHELAPDDAALRLNEWLYEPGLPSNVMAPTSSVIYSRARQRADAFQFGTTVAQLGAPSWSDVDVEYFLQLVSVNALRPRMAEVDAAFGLSSRVTPPLIWLLHAATTEYAPARPAIERALLRGGPNNWITQLYTALRWTAGNRAFARDVFERARGRYHDDVEAYVESFWSAAGNLDAAS
jgi:leukotriene-A4 hydrolase